MYIINFQEELYRCDYIVVSFVLFAIDIMIAIATLKHTRTRVGVSSA